MMLNNSQKGVTLAELAVSITIIAMLVAGTFAGTTMLKAAKIRKSVGEFTSFMNVINEFQTQYSYLPGDLPTASSYWSGANNGSGDGVVSVTGEDLYVWEHLGKSKLIAGTYTGATSGTYVIGTNSINSEPFTTGVFSFWTYNTSAVGNSDVVYSTSGNALRLGSLESGMPTAGFMFAKDAYAIDMKLDDGLAASGMFYAVRGVSGSNNCVADTTNIYNLSGATASCTLYYWQKKF